MFAKDFSNKQFSPPRHQGTKFKFNKNFFLSAFVAIHSGLSGLGLSRALFTFNNLFVRFDHFCLNHFSDDLFCLRIFYSFNHIEAEFVGIGINVWKIIQAVFFVIIMVSLKLLFSFLNPSRLMKLVIP